MKRSQNLSYEDEPSPIITLQQEINFLTSEVHSNEPARNLSAMISFRKLLTFNNPPIQEVLDANIVPRLVEFLSENDRPHLQLEASWTLTIIASGESSEQTRFVIEAGAVGRFRDLLVSPHERVREQAVWALGNIAGDSADCRNCVLAHGVLEPLLRILMDSKTTISMLRNATWTLSNFCRGKPLPSWDIISPALPALAHLIFSNDETVIADACWALSFMSEGPKERIQSIIDTGCIGRLVLLLLHSSFSIQIAALRVIGNIVSGDDIQTQMIINAGILPCIPVLLSSPRITIRKELCWIISNITAGNCFQIQAVINAQIFPRLIALLSTSEFDVKKEVIWALSNATKSASPNQIRYLVVECNIIEHMCEMLSVLEVRIIGVILQGLENILKTGETDTGKINEYAALVEKYQGIARLELLQNHQQIEIYEKTVNILELYFAAEEEAEISSSINLTPLKGN